MDTLTPFIIWLNKSDLDKLLSLLIENANKKDDVLTRAEMDKYCEKLIEINNKMCDVLKNIEPLQPIQPSDIVAYRFHKECSNIQQLNEINKHCSKYHPNFKEVKEKVTTLLECEKCTNHNSSKLPLSAFENKYKPNGKDTK